MALEKHMTRGPDMRDLFLVRRSDDVIFIYCPVRTNMWRGSWMPTSVRDKIEVVIEYLAPGDRLSVNHSASSISIDGHMQTRRSARRKPSKEGVQTWDGREGWVVRHCIPGAAKGGMKGSILLVPDSEVDAQNPDSPPMGLWRKPDSRDSEHILMERSSFSADRIAPTPPFAIEMPFCKMQYSEREGGLARLDITPCKVSIDDKGAEDLMARFKEILLGLARRPGMRIHIVLYAENAAVPAMRHVKKLLKWASEEASELLFLTVRGFVTILRPKGFTGMALIQVLQFIQKVAPAPWPETVLGTVEEADAFLAGLPLPPGAMELPPLTEKTNSGLTLGQASETSLVQEYTPKSALNQEESSASLSVQCSKAEQEPDQSPTESAKSAPEEVFMLDGNAPKECASCGTTCCVS